MWAHLRIHHPEVFTALQRHGVLPDEITVVTPSPAKPAMSVRPKFNLQSKGQADGLATEWLLDSHNSLTACENQRHRDYATFISGGAYKSPSYYTVKKHSTMFATDGRKTSSDFVSELRKDNIKPAGASDPWSDNGIGLLGSTLHGISRQPPSILVSPRTNHVSIWELETHLAGASPFGKLHHTATVIREQYDSDMQKLGACNPVEDLFANIIDGASNMQSAFSDRLALWCNVHKLQRSVESSLQEFR